MHNKIMHLIKGELIGKTVTAIIGKKEFTGEIVDESKHTFTIEIECVLKKIIKKGNKFRFESQGKEITINGDKLIASPDERVKIKTN